MPGGVNVDERIFDDGVLRWFASSVVGPFADFFRRYGWFALTMLLFIGSLVGIHIGAYGTKVVKEVVIRLVTGSIIMLCVLSRVVAVPSYLSKLGWLELDSSRAAQVWNWKPQTPLEAIWSEIADHAEQHPDWLDDTAD